VRAKENRPKKAAEEIERLRKEPRVTDSDRMELLPSLKEKP
jgi:hypothetical protein